MSKIHALSPLVFFFARTYINNEKFDRKDFALHAALSFVSAYYASSKQGSTYKYTDIILGVFKFSIISTVAILIQGQPTLIKIGAKVATELFVTFGTDSLKGEPTQLRKCIKENIFGVAAHHALNEYRVFDSLLGEKAWIAKPATRSVCYGLNTLLNSPGSFSFQELCYAYLGNAAYLNIAAPKILSHDLVEKSAFCALNAVAKGFITDIVKQCGKGEVFAVFKNISIS
ncbi:MAG: hypothetical protein ACK5WS_01895 [Alphaproteobacteria bacterium]|jgi:hypothetical protein|nr:hypothetical protein [Candidatus Jidaibacter sp.]